jgi:hypothetical protein
MLRAASAAIATVLALAIPALGLAGAADAGTLGDLHPGGGFEDARLGDSIDSFPELERIGSDPEAGTETYVRPSDDLRVGGVRVDGVSYSFYEGHLYFISLRMTGPENSRAVLAALERAFGPSIATGTHPNERIWPGGDRFVLYDYDEQTNRGMAAMTSTPIHARMRLERSQPPARISPDL